MVRTIFLHGSRGTVLNQPVLTQLLVKWGKRGTEVQVTCRRPCKRFASEWHPQFPLCVLSSLPKVSSTDLSSVQGALSLSLSFQFQQSGKLLPSASDLKSPETKSTSSSVKTWEQLGWDPQLQSGPDPQRTVLRVPWESQQWWEGPGTCGNGSFLPGSSPLPTFPWELIFSYESSDYLLFAGDSWKSIRLKIRLKKKSNHK